MSGGTAMGTMMFWASVLHALLSFLPYFLVMLYPFRKRLRFTLPITVILILALTVFEIAFDIFSHIVMHHRPGPFGLFDTIVQIVIYFVIVKEKPDKLLFVLVAMASLSNCIRGLSLFLENLIFGLGHFYHNNWSTSLCLFVLQVSLLVPICLYIKKHAASPISESPSLLWRFMWLVPTFFYFVWYYVIYMTPNLTGYDMALKNSTAIFIVMLTAGSLFVYHLLLTLIWERDDNIRLSEEKRIAQIQHIQYLNLMGNIKKIRVAHHDIRHHMMVIDSLAREGDLDNLREYIGRYTKTLNIDPQFTYCADNSINLIIGYYAKQAENAGVSFKAAVRLPESFRAGHDDICILLGNLLDNALYAAAEAPEDCRTVNLTMMMQGDSALLVMVKNTCLPFVLKPSGEGYMSTKHEGAGYGLFSVRRIAKQCNGTVRIENNDGQFTVSVLMYCARQHISDGAQS